MLTEGRVTEPSYLAIWARRNCDVHIEFCERGNPPLALVQKAREFKRKNRSDFDEIWCVFDVDEHAHVNDAINQAQQCGIGVALSNPCFELWVVLHHEDQTAHIDRRSIQRRAVDIGAMTGKNFDRTGEKALIANYATAKERARRLKERHLGNGSDAAANPSTSVWELVDRLQSP